ncbi:MAG: RCC1 domain-containing protein [Polyangia bacterium]
MTAAGTCSSGSCVTPAAQTCAGNLVCSANACKSNCGRDSDCESGYFCQSGKCHLGAKAIAAGSNHTCALRSDGKVFCWGDIVTAKAPELVQLSKAAVAVSSGGGSSCALLSDATVVCWGVNYAGQLGNGTFASSPTPVPVQGLPAPAAATAIAVGTQNACAISGGAVYCWGDNSSGQLGDGMVSTTGVPMAVRVSGLVSATKVAVGYFAACAVAGGKVYCWGNPAFGDLGNGTDTGDFSVPQLVTVTGTPSIAAIAAGYYAACLVETGGAVYCWGDNASGTLGRGGNNQTLPQSAVPGKVSGNGLATGVSIGGDVPAQACALDGDGAVQCWGNNLWGELGNGVSADDHSADSFVPVSVVGLPAAAIAISAGTGHTCAVVNSGAVWCWGLNGYGQLGDGTTNQSSIPVQVLSW